MASVATVEMNAEEAFVALEAKLQCRFNSLRRAFLNVKGSSGDAALSRSEFRQFLRHTGIECKGEEFAKLWKKFDASGDGKLSYAEVQAHFGRIISPAAEGLRMNRPETPRISPTKQAAVARMMRKKIQDVEATFNQFDTDGSGLISHAEFILALRRLGIRSVSDEESANLMNRFREKGNTTGDMTLEEFKNCVSTLMNLPAGAGALKDEAEESVKETERLLHDRLGKGEESGAKLVAAFVHYDPDTHGEVSLTEAKAVLDGLLGGISSTAFKALVSKYDPDDVGAFLYREWATDFSGGVYRPQFKDEVVKQWVDVPALAACALRPVVNPLTRKPYSTNEIVKKGAFLIGLSEQETRMILFLMGRKAEFLRVMEEYDDRRDGYILPMYIRAGLERMNVEAPDDLMDQIKGRYVKNSDGKISYLDIARRLTPFIEKPGDAMLERLFLEKDPVAAKLAADARRDAALGIAPPSPRTMPPASSAGGDAAGGGLGLSMTGTSMGVPSKRNPAMAAVAASMEADERGSVATSHMDLGPTIARMKKVLGSGWSTVLAETLKAQAKAEGRGSAAGGPAVSGTVLRDMLAAKGVTLTSKELRALSLRYHGQGPVVTRDGDGSGVVDVEALMRDTFGKSGGAGSGPGAAERERAGDRAQTAPAHFSSMGGSGGRDHGHGHGSMGMSQSGGHGHGHGHGATGSVAGSPKQAPRAVVPALSSSMQRTGGGAGMGGSLSGSHGPAASTRAVMNSTSMAISKASPGKAAKGIF